MFQDPHEKREFANSLLPAQIQCFIALLVFLLSLQKHYDGSCLFLPHQLPDHQAEWFERPLLTTEKNFVLLSIGGTILSTIFLYPFKDLRV